MKYLKIIALYLCLFSESNQASNNIFDNDEITLMTFSYMKLNDILKSALVNKRLNKIAHNQELWKGSSYKKTPSEIKGICAGFYPVTGLEIKEPRLEIIGIHLRKIGYLTELRELDLSGCIQVVDFFTRHIRGLKNLEVLDLSRCKIADRSFISNYPKLRSLSIVNLEGGSMINEKELEIMASFQFLKTINFSVDNYVYSKFLKILNEKKSKLEELNLWWWHHDFTPEDCKFLKLLNVKIGLGVYGNFRSLKANSDIEKNRIIRLVDRRDYDSLKVKWSDFDEKKGVYSPL